MPLSKALIVLTILSKALAPIARRGRPRFLGSDEPELYGFENCIRYLMAKPTTAAILGNAQSPGVPFLEASKCGPLV